MTLRGVPFLRLFIPLAVLLVGAAWLLVISEHEADIEHLKAQELLYVSRGASILELNIEHNVRDLKLLAADLQLAIYMASPDVEPRRRLEEQFSRFVEAKPVYDQVRVLDRSGNEVVRVDLRDGKAVAIAAEQLQNKADRYYFTDAMRLSAGQIYVSPLDLNVERGAVERPFKPMLRLATPIFDSRGKRAGIVILNYLGADLISQFRRAIGPSGENVVLLNEAGYWLTAADPEDEWGFQLGRPERSLATRHPAAWARIQGWPLGQFEDASGLWSFVAIDPLAETLPSGPSSSAVPSVSSRYRWYVVSLLPARVLADAHRHSPVAVAAITLCILFLVGFGIARLLRITVREASVNNRFHAYFQHGMVGMATATVGKRWAAANPALCTLLGYSESELLQKSWAEITHLEDLAANVENFDRVMRGECEGYSMESRFIRKDGAVIDVAIASRCIRQVDGSVDYFVVMVEDITARKQVARSLEESQATLRSVSDNLPESYLYQFRLAADGRQSFLYLSSGVTRIHGILPEDVIASPELLFGRADPLSRRTLEMAVVASAGSLVPVLETIRIRRGDGSWGWLQLRSSPHRLENGDVQWNGVATDVTQQHENELTMRHTARRAEVLLQLPQQAERLGEPEFMQFAINRAEELTASQIAFIHLVNEDEETIELVAWSSSTLDTYCTAMHDRHYPVSAAGIWAEAIRQRKAFIFNDYAIAENKRGLPPGHAAMLRLICLPVIEEGKVRMVVGVGNKESDYAEIDVESLQLIADLVWRLVSKHRTDRALRAASKVVNASSVVCFRWNGEAGWPVVYVSENVRCWGYEAEALLDGQPPFSEIVHPDDISRVTAEMIEHTVSGRTPFVQEYRIVTREGQTRWVIDETHIVRRADGSVEFYEGVISDITEQKQTEQNLSAALSEQRALNKKLEQAHNQLLQSEKLASIGQLAAGVAHELNNPIGFVHSNLGTLDGYVRDLMFIIESYATALAEGGESLARTRMDQIRKERDFDYVQKDIFQLVSESRDGLDRLRRIVQDLKTFARVGSQDWEYADLNQGLESTLNIVWNELKYKCTVVKELAVLPPVYCQVSQLNQVFMNLLVNAGHAIEVRGEITLRSYLSDEGMVVIEVVDTGKGIPPENMARIFDPFFTTKPVGKGTGLGLSLSYTIVQAHQGRIEVESQPGQGTTFRVILPVNPSPAPVSDISGKTA